MKKLLIALLDTNITLKTSWMSGNIIVLLHDESTGLFRRTEVKFEPDMSDDDVYEAYLKPAVEAMNE